MDDEIELLKAHILFLTKKGYEVTTVSNGTDAIDQCRQQTFDLVLLDEMMPGLSGLKKKKKIKEISPATPVVMVTKSEEENIMDQAIGSKIADYLIKPVNPNQILLTLKKNIHRKEIVAEVTQSSYQQDFLDISMLAAGEVPLVLPNERGQLTVDPMTGNIMAGADAAQGRPLPWIDVPGFTPPQVQNAAAETAAENGIMVSLPMPATEQAATAEPPAPSENTEAAPQTASGENATTAAPQAAENTVATEPATPNAAPASAPAENAAATQPAQPAQPKAAAMPKDDDWDLPAGFDSKNAFVPIEAE